MQTTPRAPRTTARRTAVTVALATLVVLLDATAAGSFPAPPTPPWAWPITPPTVVREFAAPASEYGAGHRGIDVAAAAGTTVTAPADGIVTFAGTVVDRGVLTIEHDEGWRSSYEPIETDLVAGDVVRRGAQIGTVAASPAHCPATCLHVGVRWGDDYVSPRLLLGGLEPSILLPLDG